MKSKYILCFAVLIAAIEAFAPPRYIAIPIEEYEALINGHTEPQSHGFRLGATSLSRHKRSSTQFTPIEPPHRQHHSYRKPQYVQMQPYSPYSYEPERERFEASENNEVVDELKRPTYGTYKPQYRPRPQQHRPITQQYAASDRNEVVVESLPLRPFTGGYDGTPQYNPSQKRVVYVEDGPSDEYSGGVVYKEEDPSAEYSGDLDQGASSTHSKRDSGYGHGITGDDHVDYGAYTGEKGAFGWYSDHPVLLW